jgi:hypothetical protein
MGLWVSFLGMNEVRELGWVTNEEDGSVVEHPVEVALLGSDLDGKPTGVTSSISGARLASDGRETHRYTGFVAHLGEEVGAGEVGDVVRDFKVTMGTSTFGMHDSLWDTFPVKVSEEVNVVEVLK